jgi:competence CoiA-like predicted nuclease
MPALAETETGELVSTSDLGDLFRKDESLRCPYCGGILKYRQGGSDEYGRKKSESHFWHPDSNKQFAAACSGTTESRVHTEMKRTAVEYFQRFPHRNITVEQPIGEYTADVVLSYPSGFTYNGIVAEVQHRNTQKKIQKVTLNYLSEGYLVVWVANITEQMQYYTIKSAIESLIEFTFIPGKYTPEEPTENSKFFGMVISHSQFKNNTLPPFDDIVGYQRKITEYSDSHSDFKSAVVRMKKLLSSSVEDTAQFWKKYNP